MTHASASAGTEQTAGRRLLVVVNPVAGRRRRSLLVDVLDRLDREGARVTVRETTAPGDARRLAAAAVADAFDAVIAAGGDGTVNEAVNGLAEGKAGLALGLIPLGTTNVLAGEVGLAATASDVASVLATAAPRPIYPGRVDGHLFMVMASVGLDARVVASVDLRLKRWLGKGAYAGAAITELMGRAPPPLTVRIGDREIRVASIVAAKGRRYAGPYVAAPAADLGRPDLEVCLLSGGGRWDVARQALALVRGRFSSLSDLEIVRAPMLEITGPEGQPVQADGDVIARLPVTIDVTPEPILLLAP